MYLTNLFIENMGAIEKLQLIEEDLFKVDGLPKPIILIGQNGSGKTTLLSSVVDAMYELANNTFDDILSKRGAGYSYFKVSGSSNVQVNKTYGFSYVAFKEDTKTYEYIDKNGILTFADCKDKTNNLLSLSANWENDRNHKKFTPTKSVAEFEKDFSGNSYCYFPSDRFELPYWINRGTELTNEQFNDSSSFSGRLDKDILIRQSLNDIKGWILDVFLDSRADIESSVVNGQVQLGMKQPAGTILQLQQSIKNIEKILTYILQKDIALNLNYRGHNASRIKIIDKATGADYIPSLDNLSAGQSTLLGIFITIIKHSDKTDINKSINLSEIKGVVLIDELDLHLHIALQKDVLPNLIQLFPKVQFIVTSHSPFFLNGMSKIFSEDEFLMVNMPTGNLLQKTDDFEEFDQAYEIFDDLTNSYKEELVELKTKIAGSTKPIIITEGKTDWKHLKKALEKLTAVYPDLDIEFLEYEDDIKMGSSALNGMIQGLQKVAHDRKIICIFDRDEQGIIKEYGQENFNDHGNNIYSFCIPKVSEEIDKISIEYYYSEDELKTFDENDRRLFLGTEFHAKSGNSKCGNYQLQDKKKANKQIVIDNAVFKSADVEWDTSIALTKNAFAENILNDVAGFDEFNFDKFKLIFDVLKEIAEDE